jgi:hypothetical protein
MVFVSVDKDYELMLAGYEKQGRRVAVCFYLVAMRKLCCDPILEFGLSVDQSMLLLFAAGTSFLFRLSTLALSNPRDMAGSERAVNGRDTR